MNTYHLGWRYFQQQKRSARRKIIIKEILKIIIVILVFLAGMAIGGQTFPY